MSKAVAETGEGRIPVRTKFFFGLGATAEFIALISIASYAMLYYNQVLGVSATLAGLAVSVGLVLDGFADPIIGSLSDRTRGKWGRRHPFMFAAPIPVAISLVAIFHPPADLPELWLFVWFMVFVTCLRISMAAYHVPHLALGGEMSSDYAERSRIMSWNSLFAMLGAAGTSFIALSVFFHATPEYPRGLLNPEAYPLFAFSVGGAAFVLLMISAWFTRDRIPLLPKTPDDLPPFSLLAFLKDVAAAFGNRNYLWLLVGYFLLSIMLGARQTLEIYMRTFFWGFTSEEIRWFVLGLLAGYFTGFLVTAKLHGRFDKRRSIFIACIGLAALPAVAPSLRLLGWFPENGDPLLLPLILGMAILVGGVTSIMSISVMSALADVADQNELKHGFRQEGMLYSTRALFAKIDNAVGHLIAGIALDQIAFPTRAKPGEVDADVLAKLGFLDGPVLAIPGLIAVLFYMRYRITRQSYEETKAKLVEARRLRAARAKASADEVAAAKAAAQPAPG
jgi:glycoside/pentoside/hexuronide:cation symporter, GPH family